MTLTEIVEKYIEIRDKKALLKADYEAKVAKVDTALTKLEGILLKTFDEAGMESCKTAAGTAYKTTRTSFTVADRDTFIGFVKDNEAWEMLESRCSKKAAEEFMAANGEIPPGVNYRAEQVVNVRRS